MIASTNSADRHRTPDQILGPYFPIGCTPAKKDDLILLSQKVARFEFENQLFEKIQGLAGRC
jgi:hypothetical protein